MQQLARCLIAAAFAFAIAPLASAQAWPVKPIRVIVNYAAGGSADLMARVYAPRLGEALGQPVVVENRAGAAGTIGLVAVAKSTRTAIPCSLRLAVRSPSARTSISSSSMWPRTWCRSLR